MVEIVEIRILPAFAIARLGSSPDPMDNYRLEIPSAIGARRIVCAETLLVEQDSGEAHTKALPFDVKFRDAKGSIRPVSPFLEIWALLAGSDELVPLTKELLKEAKGTPADVKWSVHVGNIKAYRRTGDAGDQILGSVGPFSDHAPKPLLGKALNFFPNKSIAFGSVRYIKPNTECPQIRLRFTPAAGKVYGPPPEKGGNDSNLADKVYDPKKGHWRGYQDPSDPTTDPVLGIRKTTNPGNVYAGTDLPPDFAHRQSWGYLDDECDGIVDVILKIKDKQLGAYARIAAGPPTFAPDSMPVRTVHDELEQAMFGPELETEVTPGEIEEVMQIVRRALETVRLMNTGQLNKFSQERGVGMARMDFLDVNRAGTPIVDPSVADSLAIRARHERVLLALESGSLAWFARVLREYDQVGDLSDDGRKKMPALMRGADSRHLALTRRQVSKIRSAAEFIQRTVAQTKEARR